MYVNFIFEIDRKLDYRKIFIFFKLPITFAYRLAPIMKFPTRDL